MGIVSGSAEYIFSGVLHPQLLRRLLPGPFGPIPFP